MNASVFSPLATARKKTFKRVCKAEQNTQAPRERVVRSQFREEPCGMLHYRITLRLGNLPPHAPKDTESIGDDRNAGCNILVARAPLYSAACPERVGRVGVCIVPAVLPTPLSALLCALAQPAARFDARARARARASVLPVNATGGPISLQGYSSSMTEAHAANVRVRVKVGRVNAAPLNVSGGVRWLTPSPVRWLTALGHGRCGGLMPRRKWASLSARGSAGGRATAESRAARELVSVLPRVAAVALAAQLSAARATKEASWSGRKRACLPSAPSAECGRRVRARVVAPQTYHAAQTRSPPPSLHSPLAETSGKGAGKRSSSPAASPAGAAKRGRRCREPDAPAARVAQPSVSPAAQSKVCVVQW
jgi:hypothetical protein